jgi:hypothetical protein
MNVSQIERDLYAYLSPARRAELREDPELQEYLDALESNPPVECPNCGAVIGDNESFCGDECRKEYMEEDSATDDPNKPGRGMSL